MKKSIGVPLKKDDTKTEEQPVSILQMLQSALEVPENELVDAPTNNVDEGETVVGKASLTVRRLYTLRYRFSEEGRKLQNEIPALAKKYNELQALPQDSAEAKEINEELDRIAQKTTRLEQANAIVDRLLWDTLRVEIGEPTKDVGIREEWQIVLLPPEEEGAHEHNCDSCPKKGDCPIEGLMRSMKGQNAGISPGVGILSVPSFGRMRQ